MPDVKTSGIFMLYFSPSKLYAVNSYLTSLHGKNYSQDQLPLLTSMSIVSAPTFGLTLLEGINNGSSYK